MLFSILQLLYVWLWLCKCNNPYLRVFGVCFDTEAQMYWCVSSSEIYEPSLSLSDSVLGQEVCVSVWALLFSAEARGEILTRSQCVSAYVNSVICWVVRPNYNQHVASLNHVYFKMFLISVSNLTGTTALGSNTLQMCTRITREILMNCYVKFKYLMQENQTQKYGSFSQLRIKHDFIVTTVVLMMSNEHNMETLIPQLIRYIRLKSGEVQHFRTQPD